MQQQPQMQQQQQSAPQQNDEMFSQVFNPVQLSIFKCQVHAYKGFARNAQLADHILQVLKSKVGMGVARMPQQHQQQLVNNVQQTVQFVSQTQQQQQQPTTVQINPQYMPANMIMRPTQVVQLSQQQQQPSVGAITNNMQQQQQQAIAATITTTNGPHPTNTSLQAQSQNVQVNANALASYTRQNKITPIQKPIGLDPQEILKERENRIAQSIYTRIDELENMSALSVNDDAKVKAIIELKALRLLNFQKQLRQEIVAHMRADTTLETALNPKAYKRCKRQTLREARITEKMERQQRIEAERKKRQKHQEYLNAIIEHSKNFKEFHRANVAKMGKMAKMVVNWHTNTERIQKKEQERLEKERMKLLMAEDEEGYRALVNEKKDKRLAYLLSQTDEYINSLISLVKDHQDHLQKQKTEKGKRKKKDRQRVNNNNNGDGHVDDNDVDRHVKVRKASTGEILEGKGAPLEADLDAWLDANPGWEVVARGFDDDDANDGDDDDDDEEEGATNDATTQDSESSNTNQTSNTADGASVGPNGDGTSVDDKPFEKAYEDDEYNPANAQGQTNYYGVAHRIREKVTQQASILKGGQLKQYQIHGLEWLVSLYNNNLNGILADEMGLGKTIQTIALITYLMEAKKVNGPFLIIVPLSTLSNWVNEFNHWAPTVISIIYKGDPQQRKNLGGLLRHGKFNVLLTTYEYVIRDKAALAKVRTHQRVSFVCSLCSLFIDRIYIHGPVRSNWNFIFPKIPL